MTRSEPPLRRTDSRRANYPHLTPAQLAIERHAIRLRIDLHLLDLDCLSHEAALNSIPNCDVRAFKHLTALPFDALVHFRTAGYHIGAMAFVDELGHVKIAFNDAHPVPSVRVNLMEEYFHLRLGHPPDRVRMYGGDTAARTYNHEREWEAYGCAIAALVPYGGLEAMLTAGEHIARIAEQYIVPVDVVETRITVTRLGHLASSAARQLSLLALEARHRR